jgi:enterobactin synthetase component D
MSERELLTLVLCAKEAFFKCVYPLAGRHFGHLDAQVHAIDPAAGLLQVRIVDSPGPALPAGYNVSGSFRFAIGHAFTAFELGAGGPAASAQAPTGV